MWMAMQPGCKRARLRLSSQPSDADWKLNQYSQLRFAAPRQAASNARVRWYIPSRRSQVEHVGRVAMCSRSWLMPKVSDEWANDRFFLFFFGLPESAKDFGRLATRPQAPSQHRQPLPELKRRDRLGASHGSRLARLVHPNSPTGCAVKVSDVQSAILTGEQC